VSEYSGSRIDMRADERCPFTGVVHWRQLMAGSGGSQGFPAMALLMASSAVMP